MKLVDRLRTRRRQKAHQRYERERERQKELEGKDAQEAVHDVLKDAGPIQAPYSS